MSHDILKCYEVPVPSTGARVVWVERRDRKRETQEGVQSVLSEKHHGVKIMLKIRDGAQTGAHSTVS